MIKQIYNTIEDFLLGPCEMNYKYILSYKKFIHFFSYVIEYDINVIMKFETTSLIFILWMKILNLILKEKELVNCDQIKNINLEKLKENLNLIYNNFIKDYKE